MNDSTITHLWKQLNNDCRIPNEDEYEQLRVELVRRISSCGRTLESQKIESIAIVEGKKNRNYLSGIALSISVLTLVINLYKEHNIIIGMFLLILFAAVSTFIALRSERKYNELISYHSVKLECIRYIQATAEDQKAE